MDILCLLHDSDEYGICRWPLADIARACGIPMKLINELVTKEVLKGSDKGCEPFIFTPIHAGRKGQPVVLVPQSEGPCWYSSRLVRDNYVRQKRGESTRFTDENQPPKAPRCRSPKGGIGVDFGADFGDGPSSSSSTSSSNTNSTHREISKSSVLELSLQERTPTTPTRAREAAPSLAPTFEQAKTYAKPFARPNSQGLLITEEILANWHDDRSRKGWIYVRDGFEFPIADWKADLRAYARSWMRNNGPKGQDSGNAVKRATGPFKAQETPYQLNQRIEAAEEQLKRLQKRGYQTAEEASKAREEIERLRENIEAWKKQILQLT